MVKKEQDNKKSTKKPSSEIIQNTKKLKIPNYTKEKISKLSIQDINLIIERAVLDGVSELVLMCQEVLEEKKINHISILKQRRLDKKPIQNKNNAQKDLSARSLEGQRPITLHFKDLEAPFKNQRWSWGSISSHDTNMVILRVWKDEVKEEDGCRQVLLTSKSKFEGKNKPGYEERKKHIQIFNQFRKGYVVICEAQDIRATSRTIRSYDPTVLFPIEDITQDKNGDFWGRLGKVVLVSDYRKTFSNNDAI